MCKFAFFPTLSLLLAFPPQIFRRTQMPPKRFHNWYCLSHSDCILLQWFRLVTLKLMQIHWSKKKSSLRVAAKFGTLPANSNVWNSKIEWLLSDQRHVCAHRQSDARPQLNRHDTHTHMLVAFDLRKKTSAHNSLQTIQNCVQSTFQMLSETFH